LPKKKLKNTPTRFALISVAHEIIQKGQKFWKEEISAITMKSRERGGTLFLHVWPIL